ncbi:RHS repeat-associated core domain-containing protein [Owenweeksia hongkongensis]
MSGTGYLFNGKELDSETGNYYYGARYMNPRTSVWFSVDPKVHAFP